MVAVERPDGEFPLCCSKCSLADIVVVVVVVVVVHDRASERAIQRSIEIDGISGASSAHTRTNLSQLLLDLCDFAHWIRVVDVWVCGCVGVWGGWFGASVFRACDRGACVERRGNESEGNRYRIFMECFVSGNVSSARPLSLGKTTPMQD